MEAEMGYERSFYSSVTVSGFTGSNSSHYSETVPINITVHVETEPFEESVANCSRSIVRLCGVIAGAEAAMCAAIINRTECVSKSLVTGFYNYIISSLSIKRAEVDNALKAALGRIYELGKTGADCQTMLSRDYERISSRYKRLFDELDREYIKRLMSIDRSAFFLSETVLKEVVFAQNFSAAGGIMAMTEGCAQRNRFLVSGLYKKVKSIIDSLKGFIDKKRNFFNSIDAVLINKTEEQGAVYFPVIFLETVSLDDEDEPLREVFTPPFDMPAIDKDDIFASMGNGISKQDDEILDKEFKALAESSFNEAEARVYETMLELWSRR
jgi:hypothetical protein